MDPVLLVVVGSAVPLAMGVLALFVRWERQGKRHLVLAAFLVVVVVEALLAGATNAVPPSLFRPVVAGQDIRIPDPVLALALLARAFTAPVPQRIRWFWAVCFGFVLWLLYATAIGIDNGHDLVAVLFDLKSYLYIVGTMALVAGVPIQAIIRRRRLARWQMTITVAAVTFMAMELAGATFLVRLPGLPLVVGALDPETHSLLIALGIFAFCIEACSPRPRVLVVAASLLLLASPFSGGQRASFVQLGATILLLVPFMVTSSWVRRVRFNPTDAVVFLFGFLIAGGLILGLSGELEAVSEKLQETFGSEVEAATASVRVSILETSTSRIAERPVFGWGMGDRVSQRFSGILGLGQTEEVTSHNVAVDLALRAGIVGAVLGILTLLGPIARGWRAWLASPDSRLAGAALGSIVAVAGILGKGMVETVFEKFRIGITVGFFLGVLVAACRRVDELRQSPGATTPDPADGELDHLPVGAW